MQFQVLHRHVDWADADPDGVFSHLIVTKVDLGRVVVTTGEMKARNVRGGHHTTGLAQRNRTGGGCGRFLTQRNGTGSC
jgi:hypothetical protein